MDCKDACKDNIFAINQLEAMCLLEEAWEGVKQLTIVNCWQHTGILVSNDKEPSSSCAHTTEPDVKFEVQEATNALQNLNLSVMNWEGSQHLLLKPCLVNNIEELLTEPDAPEWVKDDAPEQELLEMVCQIKYRSISLTNAPFSCMKGMKLKTNQQVRGCKSHH